MQLDVNMEYARFSIQNYVPADAESTALFLEQKEFMFSIFSVTLKESNTASPYDTYGIEGEVNYANAQIIWHGLVTLFTSAQAGKVLQWSLEREIKTLQLDHHWMKPYLTFFNAVNGKLVDLCMLTSRTTHPDSWCIQKVNKCYQPNPQMCAFISNLEATTTQVHAMAGAVATAAGGTPSLMFPTLTYEEHMSNIREHSRVIDTEWAVVAGEKKCIQAIQKAKKECVETNNANTSGHGGSHGTTGWGGDTSGQILVKQGCSHGKSSMGHDPSSGRGFSGRSPYVPLELFDTLTPEQQALLFQSREANNMNSENSSTTSDFTSPTQAPQPVPPPTTTPTPSTMPGSMVCQMLSNARQIHRQPIPSDAQHK